MEKKNQQKVAYIFGVVFIVFVLVLAILFRNPTPFQYTVFRIVLALAAAGVAAMIPGLLSVEFRKAVRATGAIAVFVIIYFFNPARLFLNPEGDGQLNDITRVYVTLVGSTGARITDAKVWTNIDATPKKTPDGGWQFDIPRANRPADGKLVINATEETTFLAGATSLVLGDSLYYPVEIQLKKDASARIIGQVLYYARPGILRPVPGAMVSVEGYEAVPTLENGRFDLPAYAAKGELIPLSVEKIGFESTSVLRRAGETPVEIILKRR